MDSHSVPVPNLPGYRVNAPVYDDKPKYKKQTLVYRKGYATEVPECPAGIVLDVNAGQQIAAHRPTPVQAQSRIEYTATGSPVKPRWVEFDKKVLRYFGYYVEEVPYSRVESYRIRKVVFFYYLEDDTMQITEPHQDNSGLPQGVLFKRMKAQKEDGSYLTYLDLIVGAQLQLYGKIFYVVDCDAFSTSFMQQAGLPVPTEAIPYPTNPIDVWNASRKKQQAKDDKPKLSYRHKDPFKQFFKNEKKVLRFYCIWDDRRSMYGDRRPYRLHYYLEDDTLEVVEDYPANSGRDPFPVFLKRGKLPKENSVEFVKMPMDWTRYYGPEDLRVGIWLTVYNRSILIHNCDTFTRSWYKENLGYDESDLAPLDISQPSRPIPVPSVPEYNGYGTLEDSLQNCVSLVPKPPKKDLYKLMNKEKIVLRYGCMMVEAPGTKLGFADKERTFVLSCFLADDTILIFEPPQRNSGIVGGKFLERQGVYKPNSTEVYTDRDLYVGATLTVHHRQFQLMEADEYTYQYMENNRHLYVMADWERTLKLARAQAKGKEAAMRAAIIEVDTSGSGQLGVEQVGQVLEGCGIALSRHQVITLVRHWARGADGAKVGAQSILNQLLP